MTENASSSDGGKSNHSSQVYYEEVLNTAAVLALNKKSNTTTATTRSNAYASNHTSTTTTSTVNNSSRNYNKSHFGGRGMYDNNDAIDTTSRNYNTGRNNTSVQRMTNEFQGLSSSSRNIRNNNGSVGNSSRRSHTNTKNHSRFDTYDSLSTTRSSSNYNNSNHQTTSSTTMNNNPQYYQTPNTTSMSTSRNPSSSNKNYNYTNTHSHHHHHPHSQQNHPQQQQHPQPKIISMSEEDAAMLSSLPKKPIANFPNEADRKRIIGCLAAILSMMYDHECDYINYAMSNATLVHDNDDEHDDDDNDEIEKKVQLKSVSGENKELMQITTTTNEIQPLNHSINNSMDDSFTEDVIQLEECFEGKLNKSIDSTATNNTNDTSGTSKSKRWGGGSGTSNSSSNNTTTNGKKAVQRTPSQLEMSNSNYISNNNSTTNNNNTNNTTPSKRSTSLASIIEQQRYRRRRHEVYSTFLVFAAELLFLDKSHAVAFLPLLNSLLEDPTINTSGYSSSGSNNLSNHGVDNGVSMGSKSDDLLETWPTTPQKQRIRNPSSFSSSPSNELKTNQTNENDELQQRQQQTWDNNDLLMPFVESLTPGAGFQCLSLLLMNYLLRSQGVGYDARIRHIMKKLGLVLFTYEMKTNGEHSYYDTTTASSSTTTKTKYNDDELARLATRKFEALEDDVALKLLKLSASQEQEKAAAGNNNNNNGQPAKTKKNTTMENFVRYAKVGSVGIAAGTLFAVSGGLAAPGIAAGLAASGFTATAAAASIVTTLTSTAAVTTIFGVGGGSLAAYKTHRRIKGLTEFAFNKESKRNAKKDGDSNGASGDDDVNLFTTICISGWLTDERDFQRPWGVEPTNPPIQDLNEKLTRFYEIYKPEKIASIGEILKKFKGEERYLWKELRKRYGRDPDTLYPLQNVERRKPLTFWENEIVANLMKELGYVILSEEAAKANSGRGRFRKKTVDAHLRNARSSYPLLDLEITPTGSSMSQPNNGGTHFEFDKDERELNLNRNTNMWDFKGEYGGELLTVRWESDMLIELCDSVTDMAVDLVGQAAKEILKQTALSTLITAIAWPYGLVKAANMIDGTWTLAIERADLAGVDLARRLLESEAGHRPVVLVGFSMGARIVYSCLKELARHQQRWEEQRITEKVGKNTKKRNNKKKKDANAIEYSREPASIVEDAIMMGLPNHLSTPSWESCRTVVAGRLVNCYSGKDLILSLMFQFKRLSGALKFKPVCGTYPVNVAGVENFDVSSFISAHSDYCRMTGKILRTINHGCPYRPNATIIVPNESETEQ